MKLLVCALLLTSSTRVELFDETPVIGAAGWNFFPVYLRQQLATVEANFDVQSGSRQVRVALMTHADAERLHEGLPHGVLAATRAGPRGSLRFRIRRPDDYVIVVDNRESTQETTVHVWALLDFAPAGPDVTNASP